MYTVLGVASIILPLQLLDNPFLLLFIQLLSLTLRFLRVSKRLAQSDRSHFWKSQSQNKSVVRSAVGGAVTSKGSKLFVLFDTLFFRNFSPPKSNHQPDKTPNKHPQTQQWFSPEYSRVARRSPGHPPDPTSPADAQ